MKSSSLSLVAFGVGIGCAALLIWLWREDDTSRVRVPRIHAPAALTPAPVTAPIGPTAKGKDQTAGEDLLATLEQLLTRSDTRTQEAVLTFKDDTALRRFLERAAKAGLTVEGQLGGLRTVRVHYDSLRQLQEELAQNPDDYSGVSANYLVSIPQAPAKEDRASVNEVPFRNDTLAFLGVTGDHSQWGRGTTIAILDTGVAADPTFGDGRLRYLDIGLGTTPGKGSDDGHGTSVAALAGGLASDAPGVAPAASLLSIRVTDANGTSDIFTISQAIVAAVDSGAKIVNVSLGGYATNAALTAAITYATERGAIIVAAAGNDQAAQLAWPAADSRVVSVGAVDKLEQQVSFSNSGPQLQLTAPGYGVQTAWLDGQRAYVDGTSASAPLVAGAIAAVLSINPTLTPQQAVQLLTRTANDAGAPGSDPAYGNGILNLGWAMNSGDPSYIDTAVSSHYFDAANKQMDFVVQNRSGQIVAGLNLNVSSGTNMLTYAIPSLAPGDTYVVKTPVDSTALKTSGSLSYSTVLMNPIGLVDKVPANNRRSSVLTAPTPAK